VSPDLSLRILLVHNRYRVRSGEDAIFDAESQLLEERGQHVTRLVFDNRDIPERPSRRDQLALAMSTVWSRRAAVSVCDAIDANRPDVVHFHNTFPLISPSVYSAARARGPAVVQTLNNFRFVCAAYSFFRDGRICEKCLGRRFPLPALAHRCYRGSLGATVPVALMQAVHRQRHTWAQFVDLFVAGLHESALDKFHQIIPSEMIVLKPNFVSPEPGIGDGQGGYALFVGRLAPEKGVDVLLDAWQRCEGRSMPLTIVGDGPLSGRVVDVARRYTDIQWLGRRSQSEVIALMAEANVLIVPSLWYEGQPRTIIESFAVGTPVIASDIGAMREMISHDENGLLFRTGNALDLNRAVHDFLSRSGDWPRMRQEARHAFEERYTAERNYEMLLEIYQRAISARRGKRSTTRPIRRP
jgi:glycosyltransferase involved in cell wall biosynthesis